MWDADAASSFTQFTAYSSQRNQNHEQFFYKIVQLKSYCVIPMDGNQSSNRNYKIQLGGGGFSKIFTAYDTCRIQNEFPKTEKPTMILSNKQKIHQTKNISTKTKHAKQNNTDHWTKWKIKIKWRGETSCLSSKKLIFFAVGAKNKTKTNKKHVRESQTDS